MPKLTQRMVDTTKAQPDREVILWDTKLPRFGLRIRPWGKRTYIIKYRVPSGRQRKMTIGSAEVFDLNQARQIARLRLAEVEQGSDPIDQEHLSTNSMMLSQVSSRYLSEYAEVRKKPSSVRDDRAMIINIINPALGKLLVAEISRADISKLHTSMGRTPYRANRVLALLSKMFNLSEEWGMRANSSNPTLHISKFKEEKRQHFLSTDEIIQLGEALSEAEKNGTAAPQIVAAFRLLLMTGYRLNEILTLRWTDIDWDRGLINLSNTKTGASTRPMGRHVFEQLSNLKWRDLSDWVIPSKFDPTKHWSNPNKSWKRIIEKAGLENIRIHDLRHTNAATAAGMGSSLPIIGKLLGHSQSKTTERYAHLSDDPLREAADQVSREIASKLFEH
jgi:integrase